jgi:hypothetical protein
MVAGAICVAALFYSTMNLVSIGNIDERTYEGEIPGGNVKVIHFHELTRLVLVFSIPAFFWWMSFIATAGEYVVGSSSAIWFFSKDRHHLESPIKRSIKNCFRYHLGSVLIASVLIPLLRLPMMIIAWAKGKAYYKRNILGRCLSCSCLCFLFCYEKLIRYLSSDGLAYMSIFGDTLYTSGQKAYFLRSRNGHSIKELTTAGNFAIWIF